MADPEVRISAAASAEDLTGDDIDMGGAEVTEVIEVVETQIGDGDEMENGKADDDEGKTETRLTFVE